MLTSNSQLNKIISRTTSPAYNLKQENKQNIAKWEKTGLLEGLSNDFERAGMSIMLENQARQLVLESNRTGLGGGAEEWNGVALPLVRRIFGEITAKDFVSVQPMTMPSGLVFYLEFKYGSAKPGFETGAGRQSQADSLMGITNTNDDPSGGLYGAGRFGYSINDKEKTGLTVGTTPSATNYSTGSLTQADYNFDTEFSASYATEITAKTVFSLTVTSSIFQNPDLKGVRAFIPAGTGIKGIFQQFTRVSPSGTHVTFVVSGSALETSIKYQSQPISSDRGDFEALGSPDINIPKVNFEMRSEEIVAKTRKLRAEWTPEFAQDLNAYHAIDAEAELTSMLSEYVSQEVDLEILDMLIASAANTEYWSAVTGRKYDAGTSTFTDYSQLTAQASAYTQATWFQTLGTKIQSVSNAIHQKTMRGGANFMAVSPKVATILESINGYTANSKGDDYNFALGSIKAGMFEGRIQVYKIPYMLDNTILLGYKGSQFLETGAVYSPYIPLMITPLVYDPNNFTPRKAISTRYAKKMIRPEFYGRVYIDGLNNY